jgi:hypothetical protein
MNIVESNNMNKLNIITDSFVSHYDKLRLEREFYDLSIENLLHSGKCNYHLFAEESPEEFERKTKEFRHRFNQLVDSPPEDYDWNVIREPVKCNRLN